MNDEPLVGLSLPPSWEEIESTIRGLDGYLRSSITVARKGGSGADGTLTIQGRFGCFTLTSQYPDTGRFCLREYPGDDPFIGDEIVIWENGNLRDFVDPCYTCTNLDRVLKIVRYFWVNGDLYPLSTWENVDQRAPV